MSGPRRFTPRRFAALPDAKERTWLAPVLVLVVGATVSVILAVSFSLRTHDALVLLAWSAGGAAVAGIGAALLLAGVRRTRTGTQTVIVALAPVVAVGIGVVGGAQAMFISDRDLRALAVVLAGAGTVAVLAGLSLGRRVATASRTVASLARDLGEPPLPAGGREPADVLVSPDRRAAADAPGELAALAEELDLTSQRLDATRAQAGALERGRRELVAWVSHDLRTPLSGMRAMVEAIMDEVVSDEATVARYHRTLLAEIERLSGLVDDLFVLASIEAGAVQLHLEPVSFDELVSDAVAGASAKATTKGIDLNSAMATPLVVELSSAEMSRVVHNLLDNAIRHTPTGRSVRVEAGLTPDGTRARLSVMDGCGGIEDADIERVFDLAYRGDAARSADTGGGGLGLAVARGLVEAHAGDIRVHNAADGCQFIVDLPLRHDQATPERAE
ncbi:MAG: ATP-binding protein [Actinomycetota bacterium]|nr:ATP-binding protein [Actinomycetota bacterium]